MEVMFGMIVGYFTNGAYTHIHTALAIVLRTMANPCIEDVIYQNIKTIENHKKQLWFWGGIKCTFFFWKWYAFIVR
jgi:3-dehydroquinate dehydratase